MNLENMICEKSYKGPCIIGFHFYEISRLGKSRETERKHRLVVAHCWRENGGKMTNKGCLVWFGLIWFSSFCANENVLKLIVVGGAQVCE